MDDGGDRQHARAVQNGVSAFDPIENALSIDRLCIGMKKEEKKKWMLNKCERILNLPENVTEDEVIDKHKKKPNDDDAGES